MLSQRKESIDPDTLERGGLMVGPDEARDFRKKCLLFLLCLIVEVMMFGGTTLKEVGPSGELTDVWEV